MLLSFTTTEFVQRFRFSPEQCGILAELGRVTGAGPGVKIQLVSESEPVAALAVRAAPAIGAKAGKQAKTPEVASAGEMGRLRWDNDFNDVYVGGVHYELTTREAARHCIRYLVMTKAFNKATARHLENEINPHVREQVKRDVLKPGADGNLRIQHYFSGSGKDYHGLRKELVKSAGRNGCFYLQVF